MARGNVRVGSLISPPSVAPSSSPVNAKAIVAQKLNLPPAAAENLRGCREGIYLLGEDPAKAHTAYLVCVPAGAGLRDIRVYVDQETRSILKIE